MEISAVSRLVMQLILLLITGLIIASVVTFLVLRTTLTVSFRNLYLKITLAIIGCGLRYDSDANRIGIFCRGWVRYIKIDTIKKKRTKKIAAPKKEKAKPKSSRRLPLPVIIKMVKAAIIFIADFLSRVQYDEGQLEVRPVTANPALAGIAFGWEQALYGIFPDLRRTINIAPTYGSEGSLVSGRIAISIKNGQVVAPLWRLLRNLPIKELIKYRFSKKR